MVHPLSLEASIFYLRERRVVHGHTDESDERATNDGMTTETDFVSWSLPHSRSDRQSSKTGRLHRGGTIVFSINLSKFIIP